MCRVSEFQAPERATLGRRLLGGFMLVLAGLLAVLALLAFNATRAAGFRITHGTLTIAGGPALLGEGRRELRLADVTELSIAHLGKGRRTFGTGLPHYCAGHFSYDGIGAVWQITDCSHDVVLIRARGVDTPILVTPEHREDFLAAVRAGRDGAWGLPAGGGGSGIVGGLVLAASALCLFLAVFFFVAGGRLRYEVDGATLVVRTWLVTKRFPLAGTTARRHDGGVSMRLAGAALPGYYTGLFLMNGKRTRIYATRLKDGVLLEGAARVFVSPETPEPFLAALRAQGVETA